ncbi:MAG: adenylyltransferase/cytidyltransferase family protein [Candidatus Micrarchaeota archaeon]|nr:adenylyltransferase/cytidyltransferase family protein [Candidatus Micrarchaeota archaeon]
MDGKHAIKEIYLKTVSGITDEEYSGLDPEKKEMLHKIGKRYVMKEEYRKRIVVVLAGGVFDLLHAGHLFFLKKAKALGDVLVVVIGRDEHIRKKGREPLHSLEERVEIVNNLKMVDLAIPGSREIRDEKDYVDTITLVNPDIIALGYDQKEMKNDKVKVIRIEHSYKPDILKTSKIIRNNKDNC